MNRNLSIGFLIVCFGSSTLNTGWATEVMQASPVVIQPISYEIQALNQQMINRDRQNRDEEIAIQGLIETNNKLTQETLAQQEDEGLKKINQTMLSYRNAIYSRDQARIAANSTQWPSRYGDLIALTEQADGMTVHHDLVYKSDLIEDKYKALNDLKDEMTALNDRLQGQVNDKLNQKDQIIEGYKKIAGQQEEKIRMLVGQLDEMDRKISSVDDIIAQKDRQIAQLRDSVRMAQAQADSREDTIKQQENQIAILQAQSQELSLKDHQIRSQADQLEGLSRQAQNRNANYDNLQSELVALRQQVQNQVDDLKAKNEIIQSQSDQMGKLSQLDKYQVRQSSSQPVVQPNGVIEVPPVIVQPIRESAVSGDFRSTVASLRNVIQQQNNELKADNELIRTQADQMAKANGMMVSSPVVVQPIKEKAFLDNFKYGLVSLKKVIQQQNDQLKADHELIKSQAAQIENSSQQAMDQKAEFNHFQSKIVSLRNLAQQEADDLKVNKEKLRWLNEVLAATRNKSQYYKLTAQQDRLSLRQVQDQVQGIKDDFARHFKDDNQFENTIVSLKDQVAQLGQQLAQKQEQVDLLKSELENKITEENSQSQEQAQVQQDLKAQLRDKEEQIARMKTDTQAILQDQENKINESHQGTVRMDENMNLAKQLINLHKQEAALLQEKSMLALHEFSLSDSHVLAVENRIKILLARHHIKDIDLQDRVAGLKNDLDGKQQEIDALKGQLEERINSQKDQVQLQIQIQDLKTQLQNQDDQIARMRTQVQTSQETNESTEGLNQQLAAAQDKENLLKQQLDSKVAESNKMASMIEDYQKRLESKDNAYNEQLGQIMSSKNYQDQMQKQVADLNAELQMKNNELVKIKKDLYDLQVSSDTNAQAKDLSLSLIQQKAADEKINGYKAAVDKLQAALTQQGQELKSLKAELALDREQLNGMPSHDETDFLRSGLQKATDQIKQKDAMISQISTQADEYSREYKEQTLEFQSLKVQLQNAYVEINHQNEDSKYNKLEIVRLKERAAISDGNWQDRVKDLTQKLDAALNKLQARTHHSKVELLEAQLDNANTQIKELHDQLNQFILPGKKDPLREKLKQAVDKIDELGRVVNVLTQKLQACGQTVDLTKVTLK